MSNDNHERLLREGISLSVFSELGFEFASKTNIVHKMSQITPSGGTAFRTASIESTNLLLQLAVVIRRLGGYSNWNYVNIILTDGEDTSSTHTEYELTQIFSTIAGSQIPFKIWIIGVGISNEYAINLGRIASYGGDKVEFLRVNDVNIAEVFEKIKVSVGIIERQRQAVVAGQNFVISAQTQEIDPVLLLERPQYAVFFTLDCSGSMTTNNRYLTSKNAVARFINALNQFDLVGGCLFNTQTYLLVNRAISQPQQQQTQQQQVTTTYYVTNSQTQTNQCQRCCLGFVIFIIVFIIFYFIARSS